MEAFTELVAPIVAVVASAAGIAIALDQLTLRTRLRRTANWAREFAESEDNPERLRALEGMRLWATARIVASTMVPSYRYAEFVAWVAVVGATLVLNVRRGDDGIVVTAITYVFVLLMAFVRGIRIHGERYRIASAYRRGVAITPPQLRMIDQMEGGPRIEFLWAGELAVAVCAASLGLGVLVSGGRPVWAVLWFALAGGLTALAFVAIRKVSPPLLYDGETPSP